MAVHRWELDDLRRTECGGVGLYEPTREIPCSEERLEAANEFFTDPAHQVDGTLDNLTSVSGQVTDCARLRQREAPSLLRFLKEEPTVAQSEEKRG